MTYIRNHEMEFLEIDKDSLVVYDENVGDTHYLNHTGKAIVDLLETENTKDELIAKLCATYDVTSEEISDSVEQFLGELLSKKVVVSL